MKKINLMRSLALLMSVCMIGTTMPPSTFVYAEEPKNNVMEITNFESLEENVKARRVPLGISAVDLGLPSELNASVYFVESDIVPVQPAEQAEPDAQGDVQSLSIEENNVSLADTEQSETEQSETEQSETIKPDTAQPESPEQPQNKTIVISDVTWKSEPVYNENEIGTYLFTPVLSEQYALAEGVAMPEIAITVYESTNVVRSWTWNDPEGYLTEGVLALPGVNAENPVDLSALIAMLPASLNATMDTSDASVVQSNGEVESTPVSVALQWNSADFVQAEDKSFPTQGEFTFTATMEDGYTLAEDASPLKITVQLSGAMLLPSAGVFSRLEIREGRANGTVIVDLLDPDYMNGNWKLEVDKDYYLCAEMSQNSDITHIRLRYGNSTGTANGVTFANPPGGAYVEKEIEHDYLRKLSKRENFPDIAYGFPEQKFALEDGIIEYEIKSNLTADRTISLAMGLVVKDELFVSGNIADAVSISAGKQVGGVFTDDPNYSHDITLKMADKVTVVNEFSSKTASAEIGSVGSTLTYRPATTFTGSAVALLYNKLEFDVTYPKDTILSVGFNQSATTTTNQYQGVIKMGAAKQDPANPDMLVSHVTIGPGWKEKKYLEPIYMKLTFSDNDRFAEGQEHTVTVSPTIITVGKNNVQSIPGANEGNIVTYTLLEKNADRTTLTGTERTVYNNTIDMGVGARYHIPLGTAVLKNESASSATPYAKTFEAQYNTGNTAANISRIIVPIGDNTNPKITWEGIASDGSVKSGTVTTPSKYLDGKDWASSAYLLLPTEEFKIVSFTSVKAEIGKLRSNYNSSSNTSYATYRYHICAAFGYFTTDEPGLVVRNTFRIYNTDVALQSRPNGDISAEGVAISTDWCGMAVAKYDNITLMDKKIDSASSVKGGETAIIKGELLPYELPLSAYHPDEPTRRGTTAFVTDPIFYLTLPQGLTLVSEDLKFQQKSTDYLTTDPKTVTLKHTIENVSYLNTTGDGVSIYKITFPDKTTWGYYDENNRRVTLTYEIKLLTSKSLVTQRYRLNDLVSVTTKNGMSAVMRQGLNNGYITFVNEDKYGLNDGKPMTGIATDSADSPLGFAVQQQAEINVYNAVAVTKIDGQTVPERWYSYDVSDPNSIAMLGRNSEGRLRLRVSNTSDAEGKEFAMVLPLPKLGLELGDVFMENKPQFTLSMEYDQFSSNASFAVKYIKLAGANDTIPPAGVNDIGYKEVLASEANAVLLTADNVPKGDFDLYLNFKLSGGTPDAMNIWRPAYSYVMSSGRHSSYGSYVASSVAGSGITGVVWNDVNRNGQREEGESGVDDVTVVAKDEQNRILSTKTEADGSYTFLAVRESKITLSFITDNDKNLRFNVQPLTDSTTKTVSSVQPDANGLRATKNLDAKGDNRVNAAMSGFITLAYNANTGTGSLPKTAEYVVGGIATVAVKPDNLSNTGYRFVEWNTKADGSGMGYQPGNTLSITENVTLYAIWEIASYTITFNYRGATSGNTEGSRIRQHGDKYGTLPDPTKVGYDFKGWMDSSAGTVANVTDDTDFTTGRDSIVYALWVPKVGYGVKYNTNRGNVIDDKAVTWTGRVLPSVTPTRMGYDFVAWQYKDTNVLVTDTFGDLSDSDASGTFITLDAVWKVKTGYTVKYNINGGDSGTIPNKTVSWADKNLLPSVNPTWASHAFAGWKIDVTDVRNTHSYGDLAGRDSEKTITLIAQWVEIIGNVVSYNTDGGTPVNDKVNVGNDDTNLLPSTAPTKHGYKLDKWVVGGVTPEEVVTDSSKYSDLSSTDTLTLKAVWSEKNYKIVYQPNNNTSIGDKTNVKFGSNNLLPTAPTKSGYTFEGWYYDDEKVEMSTKVQMLIPNDDAINDTLTLQAHWTEKTYLVQYNSDGGKIFTPKQGVKYTDSGLLPDTAPTKRGYTFDAWYVGNIKVDTTTQCSALLTKDTDRGVTLLAKWKVKNDFSVKYNTAGDTQLPDKSPVSWTDKNLIPATPPTKTGYELIGWTVGRTPVTITTAYSSLAESDQAGSSVTLVASWREKSYTISYDLAGYGSIQKKWSESGLLPEVDPKKVGYIFTGWYYDSAKVALDTTVSVLIPRDDSNSILLKAGWKKDPNLGSDISGIVTDKKGNLVENAEVRLTQGSKIIYGPAITNPQGEYLLFDLKTGIYNLVAEKNGLTVTVIITIIGDSVKQDLVLPTEEKNSILEVAGTETPAVVVGNLNEIAEKTSLDVGSTSLTIKLTVKKEAEQTSGKETEHREIRNLAGADANILYLDALLTKQVDGGILTDIGNRNNVVLEMVIPFDLIGKENVRIYRHHGSVNEFRKLPSKPTGVFADETYYFNESAGLIHIYAKKYSTYAISYRTAPQYYSITLSAGAGGHIEPNKSKVTVRKGDNAGFNFVPDHEYSIAEVKVDGSSVGAINSYLFQNVDANHTLSVTFKKEAMEPGNSSTGGTVVPTPTPTPTPTLTPDNSGQTQIVDFKPYVPSQGSRVPTFPSITIEGESSTPTISELPAEGKLGNTTKESESIVENEEKELPTQVIRAKKPFILLSAILALLGVICALLTMRRKRSKKTRVIAIIAAVASVLVFFFTSGWSGIKLINIWTIFIAVLTFIPAWLMFCKTDDDDSQQEQSEDI